MNTKDFKSFAKANHYVLQSYLDNLQETKLTKKQKEIIEVIEIHLTSYKLLSENLE